MTFFDLLNTASNGLEAQRAKMEIISNNIANSSTPGYKRQIAIVKSKQEDPFATVMARELGIKDSEIPNFIAGNQVGRGIEISEVVVDKTPGQKLHMPNHPNADENGDIEMSNVDTLTEMLEMMYAVRNYKANLSIVEMAKAAAKETMNMGKAGG
jgi:flagellar basal-body rod protein FlgC